MNKDKIVKTIKKLLKFAAAVAVICFTFMCILTVIFTSWKDAKINNLNVYYSKVTKDCTAGLYEWDGNTENMTVIIPDEFEGIKLSNLGGKGTGSAPALFHISLPENIEIRDEYNFTVKLGKNINCAEHFLYTDEYTDYKGNLLCRINYYYEVSEDNKWIYSKDGKIYDKKTDEPVGLFYE